MNVQIPGDLFVDDLEEAEHIHRGVTLAVLGQHLTGGYVERGKQIGGPVALVVVGEGSDPSRTHGK